MVEQSRQTVLVVDDMPNNIALLSEVLHDEYRIKVALNGKEALDIVRSSDPPDIVLMDVMMPQMDGYEACEIMKSDLEMQSIPVIFVTAMDEEREESRGFEIGAVDYITKPISPEIVKARVGTHLSLHNQSVALERKVAERTRELYATRLEIVRSLGTAAEFRDKETGDHIMRMSRICRVLAEGLGLGENAVDTIFNAAPMHDVGKIGIPDNILGKPGKLAPEEWRIMKTHTTIGANIIGKHDFGLLITARRIALAHHEKWDGTGYPEGLRGEDIPVEGRIAAVADVFDALTSERPYKAPWPVEEARDHVLQGRGTHFDPAIVDVFQERFAEIREIHDASAG